MTFSTILNVIYPTLCSIFNSTIPSLLLSQTPSSLLFSSSSCNLHSTTLYGVLLSSIFLLFTPDTVSQILEVLHTRHMYLRIEYCDSHMTGNTYCLSEPVLFQSVDSFPVPATYFKITKFHYIQVPHFHYLFTSS